MKCIYDNDNNSISDSEFNNRYNNDNNKCNDRNEKKKKTITRERTPPSRQWDY